MSIDEMICCISLQNPVEISIVINKLLDALKDKNAEIIDFENPDTCLDRIEYHKAEDINGEKFGDGSDNLYCFFRNARCGK